MSNSSTSGSERRRLRRLTLRYLGVTALLVALALPGFMALAALAAGQILDQGFDIIAQRMKQKIEIAEELPGPRIIAVAGSNTFFNFRAVDVEAATGRSTINLGTHVDNGLPLVFYQAEEVAREGDIILLPLEASLYESDELPYWGANVALTLGSDFFMQLPLLEKIAFLRHLNIRRVLKGVAKRLGIYDAVLETRYDWPINERGDLIWPPADPGVVEQYRGRLGEVRPVSFTPSPDAMKALSEEAAQLRERGVSMVVVPPGVDEQFAPGKQAIVSLAAELEAAGIAFVQPSQAGLLPAETVHDTIYHASAPGSQIYTADLIVALCGAQPGGLTCDADRLAEMERLVERAGNRSHLLDASPELDPIQPAGGADSAIVDPAATVHFSLARLSGCGNRVEMTVRASGSFVVHVGDAPRKVTGSGRWKREEFDLGETGGLTGFEITAPAGSALEIGRIRRTSDCGSQAVSSR